MDSFKHPTKLQRVLAAWPLNPVGTLIKPTGQYIKTKKEMLGLHLETHFLNCIGRNHTMVGISHWKKVLVKDDSRRLQVSQTHRDSFRY